MLGFALYYMAFPEQARRKAGRHPGAPGRSQSGGLPDVASGREGHRGRPSLRKAAMGLDGWLNEVNDIAKVICSDFNATRGTDFEFRLGK